MSTSETLIAPRRGLSLRIAELWDHRELLYLFVWRDIKVRYKQTLLGAGWAVLQPLMLMGIFTLFLSRIAKVSSPGVPYPLFVLAGLVPWTFFSQVVNTGATSVLYGSHLIGKIYFPRLLMPISAAGSYLIDFFISLALLIGVALLYGFTPVLSWLALPVFIGYLLLAAIAPSVWLSAVIVRYRDVRHILPFLLQILLFASPVVYPISNIPEPYRDIYSMNPIAVIVEGFRWALIGTPPVGVGPTLASLAVVLAVSVLALRHFRKVERIFADVI